MNNKKRGGSRPGAGRKVQIPNSTVHGIRIADDDWNNIPEPRPDFVRTAITEKLKRDKIN